MDGLCAVVWVGRTFSAGCYSALVVLASIHKPCIHTACLPFGAEEHPSSLLMSLRTRTCLGGLFAVLLLHYLLICLTETRNTHRMCGTYRGKRLEELDDPPHDRGSGVGQGLSLPNVPPLKNFAVEDLSRKNPKCNNFAMTESYRTLKRI